MTDMEASFRVSNLYRQIDEQIKKGIVIMSVDFFIEGQRNAADDDIYDDDGDAGGDKNSNDNDNNIK